MVSGKEWQILKSFQSYIHREYCNFSIEMFRNTNPFYSTDIVSFDLHPLSDIKLYWASFCNAVGNVFKCYWRVTVLWESASQEIM